MQQRRRCVRVRRRRVTASPRRTRSQSPPCHPSELGGLRPHPAKPRQRTRSDQSGYAVQQQHGSDRPPPSHSLALCLSARKAICADHESDKRPALLIEFPALLAQRHVNNFAVLLKGVGDLLLRERQCLDLWVCSTLRRSAPARALSACRLCGMRESHLVGNFHWCGGPAQVR